MSSRKDAPITSYKFSMGMKKFVRTTSELTETHSNTAGFNPQRAGALRRRSSLALIRYTLFSFHEFADERKGMFCGFLIERSVN